MRDGSPVAPRSSPAAPPGWARRSRGGSSPRGKVALWDLNAEALERARSEVGASHVVALNVAELGEVEAAFAASKDALGQVDILVCSAGITGRPRPSMNIRCRAG